MSKRGRLRKYGLILIGGGLVVTGLLLSSGYGARYLIQNEIRNNGFPQASVQNISLTPVGLYIDHISLDGNDFSTVDEINATFNWVDLIGYRKIGSISVKNISLMGEIDNNGQFKLAGWDATLPVGASDSALLPVGTLFLQGVDLDLDTPQGNFRIQGKLHVEDAKDQTQSINLSLWSEQKQLSFNLDGHGTLGDKGEQNFSLDILEGRGEFSGFQTSRLSGQINLLKKSAAEPRQISGQITAGSIKTLNALLQNVAIIFDTNKTEPLFFKTSPAGHPDISVVGRWNRKPPEQFELSISSPDAAALYGLMDENPDPSVTEWVKKISPLTVQLALPITIFDQPVKQAAWAILAGKAHTRLRGTAALVPEKNAIDLDILDTNLKAAEIADLLPLDEKYDLRLTDGDIKTSGSLLITTNEGHLDISGPLNIEINKIQGDRDGVLFRDLSGSLTIDKLYPWSINGKSKFSLTPYNDQTDIAKGSVMVSGNQKDGLRLSDISFAMAGGSLSATAFTISPESLESTTTLHFDQIDIEKLSQLLGSSSLSAQGQLSGDLPVSFGSSGLTFKTGKLSSVKNGYFKYTPEQFPASLQGDDQRMQTVRQALSDFQFSALSLEMDGPMDGHMTTKLSASGTSPVLGNRPIELNLNLEGDLGRVLQQALQAGDLSSTLRSYKGDKK